MGRYSSKQLKMVYNVLTHGKHIQTRTKLTLWIKIDSNVSANVGHVIAIEQRVCLRHSVTPDFPVRLYTCVPVGQVLFWFYYYSAMFTG